MVCQVCGKAKHSLSPRKSSIMNSVTLLACDACREGKLEPRYLIVLVGRSNGSLAVRDQIVKHLYMGEDITALELTT